MAAYGVGQEESLFAPPLIWKSCDGMMVIDEHRRVLAINPALERLTGRLNGDVAGRRECGDLLACRDLHGCRLAGRPDACPGIKAMRQLKPLQGAEYAIQTSTGRAVVVSASYTPIRPAPDGPIWALVVMRDITARRAREEAWSRRAMTDALTDLPNRASFFEACRRELKAAKRYGRPFAVALVDVDGLKSYNDAYGHVAGDDVLKAISAVLRDSHRGMEIVARYGGDEFALLLPQTDGAGATMAAERLRHLVAHVPCARPETVRRSSDGRERFEPFPALAPVTISIGVAVFPADGRDPEALCAQADRRLYQGKRRGRNRVIGPAVREKRRGQHRITLDAPALVQSLETPPAWAAQKGRVRDLSLADAYLVVPWWKPVAVGERMGFSIAIPKAYQRACPLAQVVGKGRVARVEALDPAPLLAPRRVGFAVVFDGDLTMMAGAPVAEDASDV